ncbi:MAG TPA: PQQ-binding-like beta-propeller repeat protein, partial [Phycisphaerae bacterium]|nr:PQQ-binding-like beta-propeller repeat protein [Phycisphaerae bacterium]
MGCCLLAALAGPLRAQTFTNRSDREGLVPASDRDAEAWLRRAEEAATQGDWKLASDTIMRLIDQFGDRTVSIEEGHHYVSANQYAQELIGRWPAEGMETYRRLFDPEARQLLEAARKSRDVVALRQVARRFPHTSVGPEAVNLLSAWLIDMGAYGEAIDLLEHLSELPMSGLAAPIYQKLGIAYVLNAEPQAAARTLERLKAMKPAPADLEKRAAMLAEFIAKSHDSKNASEEAGWPILLGPPALMGRMPPIDPAVAPDIAQSDELPGSARINQSTAERIMKHTGRPPVWQMVSDGKSLFVTCPEGLVARDLGSFELLWKSVPKRLPRDPRLERHRFFTGQVEADNSERLDEPVTQAFYHEYRGAISTALGLVFVIEQVSTTGEHFPQKSGEIDPNNYSVGGDEFGEPNSLRAFDAQTGKAVWTKGRSGPVEDNLRYAHFLGPPTAVGKQLIAPLHVGADLQLARISPEGKLLGTILLGTGQPGMFPMNGTLYLTLHEGTLFVPTGAGMLVALSAHDLSLRWQTPYARSQMAIVQGSSPRQVGPGGIVLGGLAQVDEWLASPPLVAGSLVVLAPCDSEWLFAFDRRTGELKWQFPRGDHRYLVGSDGTRLFVAGKSIRAVDVETGSAGWNFEPPAHALLGRPALSGDSILAPTEDGLVRLRAATGEKAGLETERSQGSGVTAPPMKPPAGMLGNLLVVDGSLYSAAAQLLSRFPDIERSRAIANSTLAKTPDDKPSLLRLAEISAIRRDWREAVSLLDRADPLAPAVQNGVSPTSDIQERIRHHHVQAILNLAAQCKPDEQAALLERAVNGATRVADQVNASLAMCDLRKEQGNVRGAIEEAL